MVRVSIKKTVLAYLAASAAGAAAESTPKADADTGAFLQPRRAQARVAPQVADGGEEWFPDPLWWQQPGENMRTVSPVDVQRKENETPLDALKRLAKRLHEEGVTVLALNAVYDAGFTPDYSPYQPRWLLGDGLAINDFHSQNPYLASSVDGGDGLLELRQFVHGLGMKLVSWVNPSYVWSGSTLYTQLKYTDARGGDVDLSAAFGVVEGNDCCANPATNPGCTLPQAIRTRDDAWGGFIYTHNTGTAKVYDTARDRCVYSVWANEPSGSFDDEAWVAYIKAGFDIWAEYVDGFVLDAPNYYLGVPSFSDNIIGAIHASKEWRVAFFAEIYVTTPDANPGYQMADFAARYRIDVPLAGEEVAGWLDEALGAGKVEDVDKVFVGVDQVQAQCRFTDGDDAWCAVSYQRVIAHPEEALTGRNRLDRALTAAGGYLPAVEFIDGNFWVDTDYPGHAQLGDMFKSADGSFLEAFNNALALRTIALNIQDLSGAGGALGPIYALVRYDAFATGRVGVFAANVGHSMSYSYDPMSAFSAGVQARLAGPGADPWDLGKFAWKLYQDSSPLPTWFKETKGADVDNGAYLDCRGGGEVQQVYSGSECMPLGACLLSCVDKAWDQGAPCGSVTVEWLSGDGLYWDCGPGLVRCYALPGVDTNSCTISDGTYTTFSMKGGSSRTGAPAAGKTAKSSP